MFTVVIETVPALRAVAGLWGEVSWGGAALVWLEPQCCLISDSHPGQRGTTVQSSSVQFSSVQFSSVQFSSYITNHFT